MEEKISISNKSLSSYIFRLHPHTILMYVICEKTATLEPLMARNIQMYERLHCSQRRSKP